MSAIHTIKDIPDWEDLVHPETGTYVLIQARCDDEIAVSKEVAAEIENGARMRPTMCAVCMHEWEQDSFKGWQDLQEMYNNDEVTEAAVRQGKTEWRSAKVSLMNQMQLENAWTDEEEETALDPKMSSDWMNSHEGRDGPAITINECPTFKEFRANEPLAGNKHEAEEETDDKRPSKRQKLDSSA